MGAKYCSVYGCLNTAKQKDLSFYALPYKKNSERLKKWLNAIGREDLADIKNPSYHHVCSVHFEEKMFVNERLVPDAVPTLHLPGRPESANSSGSNFMGKNEESKVDFTKVTKIPPMQVIKVEFEVSEVAACRACLATDCRLYDVTKYGLQEAFDKLAGAPVSTLNGVRHLCLLCSVELSKYGAFRDRCQRVHELLATLQEWGPLKMVDIRAIDRDSHKLTRNLTQTAVKIVDTTETESFLSTLIKTEKTNDINSVSVYTNLKESEDSHKTKSIELKQIKDTEIIEVMVKQEKEPTILKKRKILASSEASTKATKTDTGNTEDTVKQEKKPTALKKRKSLGSSEVSTKVKKTRRTKKKNFLSKIKIGDEFYPDYDYKALENNFKVKITLLSKDEQKAEIQARKLTSNYLDSPHRCDLCGKGYNYLKTLTNHMSYHDHSAGPFECEICHFRFATQQQRARHQRLHRLKFTCQECGFVSREKGAAGAHFETHSGKTYACPHCPRVFGRSSSRYNHARIVHPGLNVSCDQCGETFLSANGVRLHKNKAHRENIKHQDFKCPTCDVNFNSLEALDKHTNTAPDCHTAVIPCPVCGENCESAAALSEHTALRHPPDQYRCHECDATFPSSVSFDTHHRRKHLGLPPKTQKRPAYTKFQYKNKKIKSFICEICGKLMQSKMALMVHRGVHYKPFKCTQCPKTFGLKYARDLHLNTHTGERPYRCEVCPAAFACQSNLHRHHRVVHLNQRLSFPCPLCDKTFTTKSSVKLHIDTVHNNMPGPKRKRRRKDVE